MALWSPSDDLRPGRGHVGEQFEPGPTSDGSWRGAHVRDGLPLGANDPRASMGVALLVRTYESGRVTVSYGLWRRQRR